jgi:N-acetylmuramoyl-L-alanine amidase
LVLHATAGSDVEGAVETLRSRGLSYHYIVGKDGHVTKCVPITTVAFHAGESVGPEGRFANGYSVGVSFVNLNDGKDPYTEAQSSAALYLADQCRKMFPEMKWVTTHAIISPGRKTDPLGYGLDGFAEKSGLKAWRAT